MQRYTFLNTSIQKFLDFSRIKCAIWRRKTEFQIVHLTILRIESGKSMKKVFVLFAVGIMLFNLCACHKENTADSPTAPPSLESSSGDASTQSENQSFDMSRVWQENYDAGFDALLAESYTEAVSYFRAAVDADPTLDIGYIALAYSIAVATRDVGQTREIFQEGLANASRARLLNQSLSDFNAFTAEALATANDFFDCNITFLPCIEYETMKKSGASHIPTASGRWLPRCF